MTYKTEDFPTSARAWVYLSDTPFSQLDTDALTNEISLFLDTWESHGVPVKGLIELKDDRFILIMADGQGDALCGKAIGANVQFVKDLEQKFNISLMDRMLMGYKKDDELFTCSFNELKGKYGNEIDTNTIIYDNTIATKEELETKWELPIKDSAYNRIFN